MTRLAALSRIGLRWHESGQAELSGPLLALAEDCDLALRRLASRWHATAMRHPAALPAGHLVEHLRSFPQQAVFATSLAASDDNLAEFADGPVVGDDAVVGDAVVALTRTAPVTQVLTPAACLHIYPAHEGEDLPAPRCLTTAGTCFRNERRYQPLRRQWSFLMREIVCLGTGPETEEFLRQGRSAVDQFTSLIDLPVHWSPATDPFFRPYRNPGYLLQRVQPSKHEATYGDLAIGSINQHHDHFAGAFGITRDGDPATSACAAFGIERWLYALTDRHGTDPDNWPDLPAAASTVVNRWQP
jgi:hypothetical protein